MMASTINLSMMALGLMMAVLTLSATAAPTSNSDTSIDTISRKFCVDILKQEPEERKSCVKLADLYTISTGDDVKIVLLCCLGKWNRVTIPYYKQMDQDYITAFASNDFFQTSDQVYSMAEHVHQCYSLNYKLTFYDYVNYKPGDKSTCRA